MKRVPSDVIGAAAASFAVTDTGRRLAGARRDNDALMSLPSPRGLAAALVVPLMTAGCTSGAGNPAAHGVVPQPPVAAKKPHATAVHGQTLSDEYFWLRDRSNPDVMAYLRAEDEYALAVMSPTAGLQDELYREMLSHIKQTDETVPYPENGYLYFSRTREGLQYPIYLRKATPDAPEQVVLDQNELAQGHAFLSLGARTVSDDGKRLAYSADTTGYRQYTLYVKDLETGKLLPDTIERVDDVVWANDSRTLFFVTEDPVTKRHDKFWRHVAGANRSDLVYEEKDEEFDLSCTRSRDKAIVFLKSEAKTSTEVRYLHADRPLEPPRLILPRSPMREYDVDHRAGLFYIRDNKSAKNSLRFTPNARNSIVLTTVCW